MFIWMGQPHKRLSPWPISTLAALKAWCLKGPCAQPLAWPGIGYRRLMVWRNKVLQLANHKRRPGRKCMRYTEGPDPENGCHPQSRTRWHNGFSDIERQAWLDHGIGVSATQQLAASMNFTQPQHGMDRSTAPLPLGGTLLPARTPIIQLPIPLSKAAQRRSDGLTALIMPANLPPIPTKTIMAFTILAETSGNGATIQRATRAIGRSSAAHLTGMKTRSKPPSAAA